MAFDFLGTFNEEEFDKLKAFAEKELENIEQRRRALAAERDRIDALTTKYVRAETTLLKDTEELKISEKYVTDPDGPRGDEAQKAFLREEDQAGISQDEQTLLAESIFPSTLLRAKDNFFDAEPAFLVDNLKRWLRAVIKTKRENVQYAILKLRDQQEQINKEITELSLIEEEFNGLIDRITSIILSPEFEGVTQKPVDPDIESIF